MNIAQNIMILLLKNMYYEDFKSSFDEKERDFVQAIRILKAKRLRISTEHTRQTILVWESGIGDSAACCVSDDGFRFSETVSYKRSTGRMRDREEDKLSPEKQAILNDEVEEIKKVFRTYFGTDAEAYFK